MVNHQKYRKGLLISVVLLFVLVFSVLIAAYILHLYHQTSAGRLMDGALSSLDYNAKDKLICSLKPITEDSARIKLELAVSHLKIAQRYNFYDSYTDLMLGRAYCLAGKFDRAIEQLNLYTEAKLNNPLGKIELGFAYRAIEKYRKAKVAWGAAGLKSDDFLEVSEADRKIGAFDDAIVWENSAIIIDVNSQTVLNDPFSDQTKIIERFSISQGWVPYSRNSVGEFFVNDGILTMKYVNNRDVQDSFSWSARTNIRISDYKKLIIRLSGKPGTYLTIETVIDGKRVRNISYMPVTQNWSILSLPVLGEYLDEIIIGIGEPEKATRSTNYEFNVDWIGVQ